VSGLHVLRCEGRIARTSGPKCYAAIILLTASVVLGGVTACTGSPSGRSRDVTVTASDYGSEWPFTVDSVTLRCGDAALTHVVVEARGVTYALNGSARGSAQVKDGSWRDSRAVQKQDPFVAVPGDLIQRGLRLCEEQ
jgi:hypothetical protein